jgi:hypothetical protein
VSGILTPQDPAPATLLRLTDDQGLRVDLVQPKDWDPRYQCLTCGKVDGCVYRWYARGSRSPEDIVAYQCNCADQWRQYRWLTWAGIGLNYMRVDWEDSVDLDGTPAMNAVLDYALHGTYHASAGNNLVLWSPTPGTGKTFLASMLAKRLLCLGFDVYFATLDMILGLYTDSWRSEQKQAHFVERVRTSEVLFIDDLGREAPGRAAVVIPMLDSVLRYRLANNLATAITTNYTEEELTAYGRNIVSLLAERMIAVEVTGCDKRPLITARACREHEQGLTRPIVVA